MRSTGKITIGITLALAIGGCAVRLQGIPGVRSAGIGTTTAQPQPAAAGTQQQPAATQQQPATAGTQQQPAVRSQQPSPAPTASRAQPQEPVNRYAALSEGQIAKLAVKGILGELHQVTAVNERKEATGSFAFETNEEFKKFQGRAYAIAKKHNPEPRRYLDDAMKRPVCIEERKTRGASQAEAEKECVGRTLNYFPSHHAEPTAAWQHGRISAARLYLEIYLKEINDPAYAQQARERFVRTLGHERQWFKFWTKSRYNNDFRGFRLAEKPMKQWSAGTVAYALEIANAHGLDGALIAELKTALRSAPKFKCIWYPEVLERPYLGGGRYGKVRVSDLAARPDVAGSGGDIECAEVKRIRSDGASLAVVKREAEKPADVLKVATKARFRWEILRRYGVPTRMTRIVYVYKRQRF